MAPLTKNRSRLLMGAGPMALAVSLTLSPERASAQAFQATETVADGIVTRNLTGSGTETIVVETDSAIVDWTPTEDGLGNALDFLPTGNVATYENGVNVTDFAILNRILPAGYGSDAASWTAASPSPGTPPLSDDPDLDGLSALIEYALNLDPESPDADQLPMPLVEGDQLTYSYPRDTSKTDISYQVEASSDLKTWTPVSDTLVGQSGNIETRKASLPLTEGRRYLRLKISRP